MNKVKCPKCGSEQIVALEQRSDEQDYDTKYLGIKDLPSIRNRIYAGVVGADYIYVIARCLNEDCQISYLVEKAYTYRPWEVQSISPSAEKIGEGVPPLIDEAYRQAKVCLAIDCPDASIAMCRASLDRMTKDKKAEGNTALHDLLAEEINSADAEIICEFTKGILYDIYVTPELARKAEERREKLQKGKAKKK